MSPIFQFPELGISPKAVFPKRVNITFLFEIILCHKISMILGIRYSKELFDLKLESH